MLIDHGSAPSPGALATIPAAGLPAVPVPVVTLRKPSTPDEVAAAFLLGHDRTTREAYGRDLREWFAWLGAQGIDPFAVERVHVDAYVSALRVAGRAESTIARRLSALAGFYGRAVDEDRIAGSPVAKVRRPKLADESQALGIDRQQARAMLDVAERSSARDHALACLLLLNGLRVTEALAIDADDIGEARGHRTVKLHRKGGKQQTAALAPRTAAAVAELIAERSDELAELIAEHGDGTPLFVTRSGRRLDRFSVWKIIRRLARAAGITGNVSPHTLRHAFITLALDAGVSLRDVQDAACHADPRTTRRYDRSRHSLDRHATYRVAQHVA